jgi:SAM-dependent methyltransferase
MSSTAQPGVVQAARRYWRDIASSSGRVAATRALFVSLWEFLRNSTPARLRQRYGDAGYDWDHRVNTTSGAVRWRDRMLGVFYSAYQPTDAAAFHAMLDALATLTHLDYREFTFLDLGSGKGRALLMASDYPFRRIVGVELLPALDRIARENLRLYKSESQQCFAAGSVCADATAFPLPKEPLVIYLFNPFPESGLKKVIANLEMSLRADPRPAYVLYHNPLLDHVLGGSACLRKIGGTEQCSMWEG